MCVESLARHHLLGGLQFLVEEPVFFIMNTLCVAAFIVLTYFIPKRAFAQFVVFLVVITFSIINYVVLFTRVRPLEAVDFSILRTGVSLIALYLNTFQMILCGLAIVIALVCLVLMFVKSPTFKIDVKRSAMSAVAVVSSAVLTVALLTVSGLLPESFGDMNKAYSKYGFVYCFTRSVFDRGIREPEDYGEKSVEEILNLIGSDHTKEPDSTPNIIAVQLESFMDPNILKGVEFEYNPIPNYSVLRENCTSGLLYVPSVGSGTANTEFEVLTGMCLDYFGTGEYPYKTILQSKNCETVCYNLSELGYTSHSFHNHTGTFYNRNVIYQNLGFNTFTPVEYMISYETNSIGWVKDHVLESEIIEALETTEGKDFVFAVSVQGHGMYPTEPVDGEKLIPLTGIEDEELKHQVEYFAYQMYEMDEFIGNLVRSLSEYEEDCILVLYGDHQPSLEYSEEDILYGDKHASEYLVWSNFKLQENDRDLEAYQLFASVLDTVGINNGLLTKIHQNYSESDDYQRALEVLEYDMLYGDMLSYEGENEYVSPDMKIGIRDISVSGVSYVSEDYYIIGENFTVSSKVCINGKDRDTFYISPTVLLVEGYVPEKEDRITVKQVTKDFVVLGESDVYVYGQPKEDIAFEEN